MHIEDRIELIENLRSARGPLVEVLRDVTGEVENRVPQPGRWSIRECMEHVSLVEEYLLDQILKATKATNPMVNIAREAMILERGMDRTQRFDSPDVVKPRNRFASVSSALDHFHSVRERTIQFVENSLDDPRVMLAQHPRFGLLNNYELLLMMAVHPHRHVGQIREIVEALKSGT